MPVYGDRLKARRAALNLTQQQVAEAIGVRSYQQYNDWEKGRHAPPIKYLDKLSAALHASIDYLVGLTDDPGARLEEMDLTPDERDLIRRRRADPYFREIIDALLSGVPMRGLQQSPHPLIDRGENADVAGPDDAA